MLNKHVWIPIIDERSSPTTWDRDYLDANGNIIKTFTFEKNDVNNENIAVERDEQEWLNQVAHQETLQGTV